MVPELAEKGSVFYAALDHTIIYALPFVVFFMAYLMVCRIQYSHVVNEYFKGRKPFAYLFASLFVLMLIVWFRQPALVLGFGGFALSGFAKWAYLKLKGDKAKLTETVDEESQPEIE